MTLTLTRKDFRDDGIFSELTDEKGNFVAVTLEHSYDSLPKLYDGTFSCIRGVHRLHNNVPFETFEITGIQGHTGVLFHVGNYNSDSDGCVLVGDDVKDMDNGSRMIAHSMIAFSKFMALLEKVNEFTLVVVSP
jgi:Family of unknown function (DUF5675)